MPNRPNAQYEHDSSWHQGKNTKKSAETFDFRQSTSKITFCLEKTAKIVFFLVDPFKLKVSALFLANIVASNVVDNYSIRF
jgi:hypothetical protein